MSSKTKMGVIQCFIRIKLNHYRMIARTTTKKSNCISDQQFLSWKTQLLSFDRGEMGRIVFFLMGRIVLKFYYNLQRIILSNARDFFNRKTIKMCEKSRLLYKPQSLSYPFISQVLKVITTNPQHQNIKVKAAVIIFGHNFQ